jgi:hypothetical protein
MAQRIRRVATQKEFDQVTDDFITQGYKVVSRGELSTNVIKKKKASGSGHLLVFLLLGWWTFLIANLLYHLIRPTEDDVLIRLEQSSS